MRDLLQLTLLAVEAVGWHEALTAVHRIVQRWIVAKRHQITADRSIVVQVVDCGRVRCAVKDINRCEWILALQNVLGRVYESARDKTLLTVGPDYPVPIGIFFIENCVWSRSEER